MSTITNIIVGGGFIMYPIVLCSIISWVIALERIWWFHRSKTSGKELQAHLATLIKSGKHDRALEASIQSPAPISSVYEQILRASDANNLAKLSDRLRVRLNQEFKSYLWILATVGAATPFLGLFGTVVGIMRAFKDIAITGETGFNVVAAGISEALIATAAGIIVAVIAVAFYNSLQVRANKLSLENRLDIEDFVETLQSTTQRG